MRKTLELLKGTTIKLYVYSSQETINDHATIEDPNKTMKKLSTY